MPDELIDFRGIPDYRNIVNTLSNAERYFVIADFMLTSHVYAIRLSDDASDETPMVLVCGDIHQRIAGSFMEFGEKYLGGGALALKPLLSRCPAIRRTSAVEPHRRADLPTFCRSPGRLSPCLTTNHEKQQRKPSSHHASNLAFASTLRNNDSLTASTDGCPSQDVGA